MSCAGCAHQKLAEAIKLLRKRGFKVLRDVSGCSNCTAEKMAVELAKEQGAAGLVFWSSAESARVAEAIQRKKQSEKAGIQTSTPIGLWVSHSAVDGGVSTAEAILEAVREVGLKADWSGRAENAVFVYLA